MQRIQLSASSDLWYTNWRIYRSLSVQEISTIYSEKYRDVTDKIRESGNHVEGTPSVEMTDKETEVTARAGDDGTARKQRCRVPCRSRSAPPPAAVTATKSQSFLDDSVQSHSEKPVKMSADNALNCITAGCILSPIYKRTSSPRNSLSNCAMSSSGISSMADTLFSGSFDDLSAELDAELERQPLAGTASLSDMRSTRFQTLKQIDQDVDQYSEISRSSISSSIPTMAYPAGIMPYTHNIKVNSYSTPPCSSCRDGLENTPSPCSYSPASSCFESLSVQKKGRRWLQNSNEFPNTDHVFDAISFNDELEDKDAVNCSIDVSLANGEIGKLPNHEIEKILSTELNDSKYISRIPSNAFPENAYWQLLNEHTDLLRIAKMYGCGSNEVGLGDNCISSESSACNRNGKYIAWPLRSESCGSVANISTLEKVCDCFSKIPTISLPNDIHWKSIHGVNDVSDASSDESDVHEQSTENSGFEGNIDVDGNPQFLLQNASVISQEMEKTNTSNSSAWYPGLRFFIRKPYENSSS